MFVCADYLLLFVFPLLCHGGTAITLATIKCWNLIFIFCEHICNIYICIIYKTTNIYKSPTILVIKNFVCTKCIVKTLYIH